MTKQKESKNTKSEKDEPIKHLYKKIENPETGEITEGEIGSLDSKSAAQNPERQKKERKIENL